MNKIVKHSISQTKDFACSSEFAKLFARQTVLVGIGLLLGEFVGHAIDNYTELKGK